MTSSFMHINIKPEKEKLCLSGEKAGSVTGGMKKKKYEKWYVCYTMSMTGHAMDVFDVWGGAWHGNAGKRRLGTRLLSPVSVGKIRHGWRTYMPL